MDKNQTSIPMQNCELCKDTVVCMGQCQEEKTENGTSLSEQEKEVINRIREYTSKKAEAKAAVEAVLKKHKAYVTVDRKNSTLDNIVIDVELH